MQSRGVSYFCNFAARGYRCDNAHFHYLQQTPLRKTCDVTCVTA